jgi:DNA-binding transcriptional LysR family regulator
MRRSIAENAKMNDLNQINARSMQLFLAVVREGCISEVARVEGVSPSTISRVIQQLEEALETQLLYRNTRAVTPTASGHIYAETFQLMLDTLSGAQSLVEERRNIPGGLIRINAPISFGLMHIAPTISELSEIYPNLKIEINLNDDYIDPFTDGTDLILRIADIKDSELHGRFIAQQFAHLVASPQYIERYGLPVTPEDLKDHHLLAYQGKTGLLKWRFIQGQQQWYFLPNAKIISNNAEMLMQSALDGAGILLFPDWQVGELLHSGKLIELLPTFQASYGAIHQSIYFLYPKGKYPSLNTRIVIDTIIKKIGDTPYWRYNKAINTQ